MSKTLLKLSNQVREVCEPHFRELGLDHFNYIHRGGAGDVTYLCSNQEWLDHYLIKSYPKVGAFEQKPELSKYSYILWNGLDRDDPILIDSKEIIGVEYGITIIRPEQDGFGYYNLGSKSSDSSIINKYINNIDKYENFISSFEEKAGSILHTAKKLKFCSNTESVVSKVKTSGHQVGNYYFTERELQCINYLSLGKTAEEISILFNISRRTVETHIENLKKKMNCFNQFRLGYLLGRMGVADIA